MDKRTKLLELMGFFKSELYDLIKRGRG